MSLITRERIEAIAERIINRMKLRFSERSKRNTPTIFDSPPKQLHTPNVVDEKNIGNKLLALYTPL